MSASQISRLGWYVRRAAAMSPAEVAWRLRYQVLRAWWSRRQVRPGRLGADAPPPDVERRFGAVLPPGTAERIVGEARAAVLESAERLLRGEWEILGVVRTDMVQPDWFLDPVTGRRSGSGPLCLPYRSPLGGAGRQRQAGMGALPAAAPHAAGHRLVPHP